MGLEILTELFGSIGEMEIYQDEQKNKFSFTKNDISHIFENNFLGSKCKIVGSSYDKEFNLQEGESYFFFNNSPFCCNIYLLESDKDRSLISYKDDNYRVAIITIDINIMYLKIALSNLSSLFRPYEGEIFDPNRPIENRWEILDL